jgi:hypothetical protein
MPADIVRVEVHGPPAASEETGEEPRAYGSLLLDQIAHRWSIEHGDGTVCAWFEIDRHPSPPHE